MRDEAEVVQAFGGILVDRYGLLEALLRLLVALQEEKRDALLVQQQWRWILGYGSGIVVDGVEVSLLCAQLVALMFQFLGSACGQGNQWRLELAAAG